MCDGVADLDERRFLRQRRELADDRGDREGHVRPGVPVGHGVDVEAVDRVAVGVEEPRVALDGGADVARRK